MGLEKIRDAGIMWWNETGRHPYLNYCIDGTNNSERDFINLTQLFSPLIFNFTFSVVCSKDETMKEASFRNLEVIKQFQNKFLNSCFIYFSPFIYWKLFEKRFPNLQKLFMCKILFFLTSILQD